MAAGAAYDAGGKIREPRAESREPRADAGEPRAESREPRAESREPRAESREPRAESREPRAESREPRAESREPRAESREPRAESREPRAESREPRAESREPRAESREPRAESREPRAESREPRVSSCPPGRSVPRLSTSGSSRPSEPPSPAPGVSSTAEREFPAGLRWASHLARAARRRVVFPRVGTFRRTAAALLLGLGAFAFLPLPAAAQEDVPLTWSLTPDGLVRGDTFRLMFVSKNKRDGASQYISNYNNTVRTAAGNGIPTSTGSAINSMRWRAPGTAIPKQHRHQSEQRRHRRADLLGAGREGRRQLLGLLQR